MEQHVLAEVHGAEEITGITASESRQELKEKLEDAQAEQEAVSLVV